MKTIGVAILCYEGFDDLVMSLTALKVNTQLASERVEFIVFDNSEKTKAIAEYVKTKHPDVIYHHVGKNVGCTRSRNIIFHELLKRHSDAEYLVIIDQDIEVQPGWLSTMLALAQRHKDCGIVAWPQAYRLKPDPVDGVVSEVASMCNLHAIQPLKEIEEKWNGPFDERFFFHKFDSLICQRLNQLGYCTRLVMRYYRHDLQWQQQTGGITHHHPHRGVRRHPHYQQIIRQARQLYSELARCEGWSNWYSKKTIPTVKTEKSQVLAKRSGKTPRELLAERRRQQPKSPTGKTVNPKITTVRRSGKTLRELLAERRKQRLRHIKR